MSSHQAPPRPRACPSCTSLECGPLRCRFADPAALRCDNHPLREAINCSGWALRRYLCQECIADIKALPPSPRQHARAGDPVWESFGGRQGITDHAYHNPNAIYERTRDQHLAARDD